MQLIRKSKNLGHLLKAHLAKTYFNNPGNSIVLIGVTGTDGKTTTANIIYHILHFAKFKVGIISTTCAILGDEVIDTGFHTTSPDSIQIQKLLHKAKKKGLTHMILEVTSHALDQNRFAGLKFTISALTNITHEHFDYHHTYDNYLNAKSKLFRNSYLSIFNADDQSFSMLPKTTFQAYSIHNHSEFKAENIEISAEHTKYNLNGDLIETAFNTKFNIYNSLAAIAVCQNLGVDIATIKSALRLKIQVDGRMQYLPDNLGRIVIIDFAHTPNALEELLSSLRNLYSGKLTVIFGCAGDRDKLKRPIMGEIATKLADKAIFTSEDPRNEDINDINDQIMTGAKKYGEYGKDFFSIPDRREAIKFSLQNSTKGDIIVITGKGHEKSMAISGVEHPWSDLDVTKELLEGEK